MNNEENKNKNFTIVPNDNSKLYAINKSFNILHAYIVERVRSFEKKGLPCYITNQQLADATGTSEKTISRAVNLLIDEKVLWAGYHYKTESNNTKEQRILRIFNKALAEYYEQLEQEKVDGQIVQKSWSECLSESDKMTTSDGQNDPLVYKENIKEDNYKKDEELNSSSLDSHNAHPEENKIVRDIFDGIYTHISKNKRRSLEEIENSVCENMDNPS